MRESCIRNPIGTCGVCLQMGQRAAKGKGDSRFPGSAFGIFEKTVRVQKSGQPFRKDFQSAGEMRPVRV